jgi:hypothetical protein
MSCYGDIYLRKDLITCDPKYGVSLNALVKEIVDSISSSSSTSAFSCASLASCSINALSDVSLTSVSNKQLLVYDSGQFQNKTFGDVYSITDIGNVSLPSDIITTLDSTKYSGKVLGWEFSSKAFQLQDAVSTTYTPSLIVGDSDGANDDIYNTDSSLGPTGKLIFKGGGNISVSYNANTNTFTIQDLSSPIFNGFIIVSSTSNLTPTPTALPSLFFGESLPTVKFYFSSITNDTNIKTPSTFSIKDGPTTVLSNQAYGSPLRSGPAITSGFTASITNTTFASKTYSIEGLNTNNQPFAASTSIRWGTNYLYGYTYNTSISAADLNNAAINGCSSNGVFKKALATNSKNANITLTYPTVTAYTNGLAITAGMLLSANSKLYMATTSGNGGSTAPSHTTGSVTVNGVDILFLSTNLTPLPYLFIAVPTTANITSFTDNTAFGQYSFIAPVTLSSVKQYDTAVGGALIEYKIYRSTNPFTANINIGLS